MRTHSSAPLVGEGSNGSMTRRRMKGIARAQRGAVVVEYALLVAFVAVPTVMGIGVGGLKLLGSYQTQKQLVLQAYP